MASKKEKLPGSAEKTGKEGKMPMKKASSSGLGKLPKGGGGFKNKAMEHKR